jgi:predicted nucleic-acid-binding protein
VNGALDDREIGSTDVDEVWLREWADAGLSALQDYLAKQAAFADFLLRRDLESDDDGSARSV